MLRANTVRLGTHRLLLQQHLRRRHSRRRSQSQMLHPPLGQPRHRRPWHPPRLPLLLRQKGHLIQTYFTKSPEERKKLALRPHQLGPDDGQRYAGIKQDEPMIDWLHDCYFATVAGGSCCNVATGWEGCLAIGGPLGPIYGQNRQRTASNMLLESHRKQSSNGLQHSPRC